MHCIIQPIILYFFVSGKCNAAEEFINSCDYIERNGEQIKIKQKHSYYGLVQFGMPC